MTTTGAAPGRQRAARDAQLGGLLPRRGGRRARRAPRRRRPPVRIFFVVTGGLRLRRPLLRRAVADAADGHHPGRAQPWSRGGDPAGQAAGSRRPGSATPGPSWRVGRRRLGLAGLVDVALGGPAGALAGALRGRRGDGAVAPGRRGAAGAVARQHRPASTYAGSSSAAAGRRPGPGSPPASGMLVVALLIFAAQTGQVSVARDVVVAGVLGVLGLALTLGPWLVRLAADLSEERAARDAQPGAGRRRRAPARLGAADARADPEERRRPRARSRGSPAPRSATCGSGCTASRDRPTGSRPWPRRSGRPPRRSRTPTACRSRW